MKKINLIYISIIYFVAIIIIAHFFIPAEYNWTENTISDLGAQNYNNADIMRIGFIGFGILINLGILLNIFYYKKFKFPDILIMIYGISILLTGFFSTAPFDGSINYSLTHDRLHSIFAQIAGIAFSFAIIGYLIIAQSSKKYFHLIFFVLVIGISALFGLSANGIIPIDKGIIQRFLYFVSFIWIWIVYS
jgi:hypothetical membrane protein